MRRQIVMTSLLLTLTFILNACTTPGGSAPRREPASGDEASDRLHDRKIHNYLEHVDTKAAR